MEFCSILSFRKPLSAQGALCEAGEELAGIEVTIKAVEGSKLAEDVTSDSSVNFNVNANITES